MPGGVEYRIDGSGKIRRESPLGLEGRLGARDEYALKSRILHDQTWMYDHRTGPHPPQVRTKGQAGVEGLRALAHILGQGGQ